MRAGSWRLHFGGKNNNQKTPHFGVSPCFFSALEMNSFLGVIFIYQCHLLSADTWCSEHPNYFQSSKHVKGTMGSKKREAAIWVSFFFTRVPFFVVLKENQPKLPCWVRGVSKSSLISAKDPNQIVLVLLCQDPGFEKCVRLQSRFGLA